MKTLLCSLIAAAAVAMAQTPADLRFEVASIRPSAAQNNNSSINTSAGGIRTSNTSLLALITNAYDARRFQIIGAAGWMEDERYDINARNEEEDTALSHKARTERLTPGCAICSPIAFN